MKPQSTNPLPKAGRELLQWLVVNPDGKLLAILDSESEAYWFTRNRGHAHGAVFFKAPCDYAAAPELLEALRNLLESYEAYVGIDTVANADIALPVQEARAAIAKATGNA